MNKLKEKYTKYGQKDSINYSFYLKKLNYLKQFAEENNLINYYNKLKTVYENKKRRGKLVMTERMLRSIIKNYL